MLAGGGSMHLVDAVGRSGRIGYVCSLHEQAAAIAADAYGQYSNSLGVALVTTGPGGTNAITGVAGAWCDSTPCLFISGQVKRADLMAGRGVRQMGFQEIGIVDLVRPITKYAVTVTDPETIRYHLEKALHLAQSGRRGPVWIDLPLDVQAAAIDPATLAGFADHGTDETGCDAARLAGLAGEAIRMLNRAERPAILAGNGIRAADAVGRFRQLVDLLAIPVLTTWKAIDLLPEDHPLYAGRPGASGQRGANFTQQTADCLLVLGVRLDLGQTAYNHSNFARGARKIIVEIDEAEIGKLAMTVELPVCADAGAFLAELLKRQGELRHRDRSTWLARCASWKRRYPVVLPEYYAETDGVNNYVLIDILSDEMEAGDLLVPGSSGACSEITMQAFRVRDGMRIFNSQGLGSMGFGVPASIGGCIAGGGRRTVCIEGDGGFQMNAQELETVRRLALPIKFFVLNNGGYGSIRATQQSHFDGRFVGSDPASGLTLPEMSGIAAAYGLPFFRIDTHAAIREQVRRVLETDGPALCEVMITRHQSTAPRVSSSRRADGTMVSRPMEDLWPLLDRTEFEANMAIEAGRRETAPVCGGNSIRQQ